MDDKYKLHGAFSWCELMTTDVASARTFYGKLFNWAFETAAEPNTHYTLLKYGGEQMGGLMAIPPAAAGMPPAWGVYVTVDDVDAAAERAVALGGKVCLPPQDIPGVGRFAVLQDPQGATINVIAYTCMPDA